MNKTKINGYSFLRAQIWKGPGVKGEQIIAYTAEPWLSTWSAQSSTVETEQTPDLKELTERRYKAVKIVWESILKSVLSPGHLSQMFLKRHSS